MSLPPGQKTLLSKPPQPGGSSAAMAFFGFAFAVCLPRPFLLAEPHFLGGPSYGTRRISHRSLNRTSVLSRNRTWGTGSENRDVRSGNHTFAPFDVSKPNSNSSLEVVRPHDSLHRYDVPVILLYRLRGIVHLLHNEVKPYLVQRRDTSDNSAGGDPGAAR